MTRRFALAVAVPSLVVGGAGRAEAGPNLVLNPGFETRDFTGWNEDGMAVDPNSPHSGAFSAFTADDRVTTLSQDLATEAGRSYTLDFWLRYPGFGTVEVLFGGTTVYDWERTPSSTEFDYQEHTFTVTATSSLTTLAFRFQALVLPARVDDVSVTALDTPPPPPDAAVPEPATFATAGLGLLMGLGYAWRRRRAA